MIAVIRAVIRREPAKDPMTARSRVMSSSGISAHRAGPPGARMELTAPPIRHHNGTLRAWESPPLHLHTR
ncbi:hypothetical protein ACFPOI_25740 [Nonomuraea angiospora]|uniref:Uncharacterized protein n=1 Tax=Nonomuraea angiospora TaxID=46172 RepID=A0ABR9LP64_9ACTN|nr:hypothetical protein [Nonomuraea angiospora]MBE1582438.1 hypothetical protein [Nonomuraea angiospora]